MQLSDIKLPHAAELVKVQNSATYGFEAVIQSHVENSSK